MEEWHAPTRLILLNGELFPIVKIIEGYKPCFLTMSVCTQQWNSVQTPRKPHQY